MINYANKKALFRRRTYPGWEVEQSLKSPLATPLPRFVILSNLSFSRNMTPHWWACKVPVDLLYISHCSTLSLARYKMNLLHRSGWEKQNPKCNPKYRFFCQSTTFDNLFPLSLGFFTLCFLFVLFCCVVLFWIHNYPQICTLEMQVGVPFSLCNFSPHCCVCPLSIKSSTKWVETLLLLRQGFYRDLICCLSMDYLWILVFDYTVL